jgi:hypothetical protein
VGFEKVGVVWWNYWGVWSSALQKRSKFKYYEEDFCTAETNGAQVKLKKKRREEDVIDSDVVVNSLLQLSRSIYTLYLKGQTPSSASFRAGGRPGGSRLKQFPSLLHDWHVSPWSKRPGLRLLQQIDGGSSRV